MKTDTIKTEKIEALKKAIGITGSISLYFPKKIADNVFDRAFIYPSGVYSKTRTRPLGIITIYNKTGDILEYRNAYINDFVDTSKYPLDMKLDYSITDVRNVQEYDELYKKLMSMYNNIREIAFKDNITDDEKAQISEYGKYFFKIVPKDLLPFYEAISPEFYNML